MIMETQSFVSERAQPEESLETSYFQSGELLFANADYHHARAIFSKLHAEHPEKPIYLERLAACLSEIGEHENAALSFEKLSEIYPNFENFIASANYFYDQRNILRAKKYYTKALCHQNENFIASFQMFKNLGNISLTEGDTEQAEEYYHRAQRIYSDSDLLYVNYGSLYFQKKDFANSIQSFQKALELNPKSSKARMGLALLYREQDETEMAWANLKAAIDLDQDNPAYLKMLCRWSMNDFRYDTAIEKVESYLEGKAYDQDLNLLFACVLFQAGYRDYAYWETQKILNFDGSCKDAKQLLSLLEAQGAV